MKKDIFFYSCWCIAVALVMLLVIWGSAKVGTLIYGDVAPAQAEVQRKVYVNTPSYINGKNEILMKYILEYNTADSTKDKQALRSMILDEASTVDTTKLTPKVQSFLNDIL